MDMIIFIQQRGLASLFLTVATGSIVFCCFFLIGNWVRQIYFSNILNVSSIPNAKTYRIPRSVNTYCSPSTQRPVSDIRLSYVSLLTLSCRWTRQHGRPWGSWTLCWSGWRAWVKTRPPEHINTLGSRVTRVTRVTSICRFSWRNGLHFWICTWIDFMFLNQITNKNITHYL